MRAIIIDDSEKARIALKSDLADYCPQVTVVGEAEGVASGLEQINKLQPDVVFLDIRMGDGTGFDLLEQLGKPTELGVIFTTAYDEYAIKAFRYAALDYLLKPIDPEQLVAAIKKVRPADQLQDNLRLLLDNIRQPKRTWTKIALAEQDRIHMVDVRDIVRCEASKNYTLFFLKDGRQLVISRTLKEYEDLLDPELFVRVHHSHLVNIEAIKELVKIDGPYLLMTDGSNVPVSVRKKELLMEKLGRR